MSAPKAVDSGEIAAIREHDRLCEPDWLPGSIPLYARTAIDDRRALLAYIDGLARLAESRCNGLAVALVEAVLPLEVIAAQDRAKPYRELSRELIEDINRAISIVRAALAESGS
jgi:hypothetical protein